MAKNKKEFRFSPGVVIWLVLLGLACLGIVITLLLRGNDVALFSPKGLIAHEQFKLMIFSVGIMLILAVPTLLLFYFFAWKYRETNKNATYDPDSHVGKFFLFILWAIPSIFVFVLVHAMWPAAHKLDPHKQIVSDVQPLTVQVIALRWKWLFIYPEQHIASVNFVQIPTGTPVHFDLTADEAPMSSFWIPHWGGQLYAMTGHSNQLNLLADTEGNYTGRSAEINGVGFAGMKFTARASSEEEFELWVQDAQSSDSLQDAAYKKLLLPSQNNPESYYSLSESDLYNKVLAKYAYSHHHITEQQ